MKSMPEYIVGIDGGGTKTDIALANRQGKILARVRISQSNLHNASVTALQREWKKGLKKLYNKEGLKNAPKLAALAVGLAGLDSNADRLRAHRLVKGVFGAKLPSAKKVKVVNDTVIGFWSGAKEDFGIGILMKL